MKSPHNLEYAGACSAELLTTFDRKFRRALKSATPLAVHGLRVASRRFAQALVIFESSFHGSGRIRRQLKTVMHRLGDVRDLDIALKFLHKNPDPHFEKIVAKLQERRARSEAKLQRTLQALADRHAISKWRGAIANAKTKAEASAAVVAVANRFFDRGEAAHASADSPKKLHRLRIAAKKLRYTLELGASDPGIDLIKSLQSRLGKIHDYEANHELFSKFGHTKKLMDGEKQKHERRIQEFHELWKDNFDGRRNREQWMERIAQSAATLMGAQPLKKGPASATRLNDRAASTRTRLSRRYTSGPPYPKTGYR